jgi:hypothetical protein
MTIIYFLLENTGFSGGTSWFDNKQRYNTYEDALAVYRKRTNLTKSVECKWRITKITSTYEHTEL